MRYLRILVLLVAFALVAAACSDGATTTTTSSTTTTVPTTTITSSTTTTSTTTVPTTTTTEAEGKTFAVEHGEMKLGFYTRKPFLSFDIDGVEVAVFFLEPVGAPYWIYDLWGLEKVLVTDFSAGETSDGEPITLTLVWGWPESTVGVQWFKGLFPSREGDSENLFLDGYHKSFVLIPPGAQNIEAAAASLQIGWPYPVEVVTAFPPPEGCDQRELCAFSQQGDENNAVIADALEEGLMPPEGVIGRVFGYAMPMHYDG